jgi:hypothetical protein
MTAEIPMGGWNLDDEFMRKISDLAETAESISREVPDLAAAVRKNGLTIRLLSIGVVLFTLALIGSVYAVYEEHRTSDRLKSTIVSLQGVITSENRTNNDVLCPLYQAFVNSFTPARRAAQPTGTLAFYDNAVAAIKKAYATLGCPAPGAAP